MINEKAIDEATTKTQEAIEMWNQIKEETKAPMKKSKKNSAYCFRVDDDFFVKVKIESAKLRKSMKDFIIEAVKEKMDRACE